MANNYNGNYTSKDSFIKTAKIHSSFGEVLDLITKGLWREIVLYQNIFGPMDGEVAINDATGAFGAYSFCGNEYLELDIDKPTLGMPIKKVFRIYKVSRRKMNTDSTQQYILHFCSEESVSSKQILVSKAYKNAKVETIVRDILVSELKVNTNKIDLESTATNYDLIIPNIQPFEAIQWLSMRAYDQNKFCYLFFENTNGYRLASLQTLYNKKPYKKIRYELKKATADAGEVGSSGPADNKDSIDTFTILNDFDMFSTIGGGGFSSRLLGIDLFHQTFKNYDYSIDGAESQRNLLNKYKPINGLTNSKNQTLTQAPQSFYKTYLEVNQTSTEKNNDIKRWYLPKAMHFSLLDHYRIKVVLPGDTKLMAGDILEFEFPKFIPADKSGKELDKARSGKYLVTKIAHKFMPDPESFESIVELASDSYAAPVPAAKSGLYKSLSRS